MFSNSSVKKKGMGDHDVNNRSVNHGALWELYCVTTMAETWPESISLIQVEEVVKRENILFGENKGAGRGSTKTTEGWLEIQKILAARYYFSLYLGLLRVVSRRQIDCSIKH